MKRFLNYFLSMSVIASLLVVTSCGDDAEDDPIVGNPSFTIIGVDEGQETETSVNVGETVSFTVNVDVPAGFNTFVVNQTVGGTTTEYDREARPSGTPVTSHSYEFSYTPNQDVAGESVIFDFIVVDDDGRETDYTYTVNVMESQVTAYNTVLLAAPTADQANEAWFSTSTGERYSTEFVTAENISSEIDFGYRYGPSSGATLASPFAYPSEGGQNTDNWTVLNETELRSTDITAEQFLEANQGQFIADAFENGTAGDNAQLVTGLQEGQVYAFMTDPNKEGGSRYGLVHVEQINMGADGTGYGSDASIVLNIKVVD